MTDALVANPQFAVLQRFTSLTLRREGGTPLASNLPLRAFASQFPVTAAYFLFDQVPDGGVEAFLTQTLGRLAQQLSRSTEKRAETLDGEVRGRILWSATYKARFAGGYHPNRYVCGEVYQDYDTPENQLLRYMVDAISSCLRAVPPQLRAGLCYLPGDAETSVAPAALRLGRMESALRQADRSARLRSVSAPLAISEFHLLRAETALLEDYASVARLYRHYRDLVLAPTWETLAAAARRVLPLPASLDGPGEDWTRLVAALRVHAGDGL